MNHCEESIIDNDVTIFCMADNADPLSRLGVKIARRRKDDLKISQDELLERMNATAYRPDVARQSHISNIENSDGDKLPSIRVLAALAVALETNCDYLVGLTDDDKPASDLEDQIVVGVPNAAERAVLQSIMDMLLAASSEDRRFAQDLLRRLVGGKEKTPSVAARGQEELFGLLTGGSLDEDGQQQKASAKGGVSR